MNWEVEQKFRVHTLDAVRSQVHLLGGRFVADESQVDQYWAHPCRDFRAADEAFRIRQVNDDFFVTFKGPRLPGPTKTRPELEIPLAPRTESEWEQLLQFLSFRSVAKVKKHRQVYSLFFEELPFKIALDDVQEVGKFVEIETVVSDQATLTHAQSLVAKLASLLELNELVPKSYLGLLLQARNEVDGEIIN